MRHNRVVSTDEYPAHSYEAAIVKIRADISGGKLAYTAAQTSAVTGIPADLIRRFMLGGGLPGLHPQRYSRYLVKAETLAGWLAMGGPSGGAAYRKSIETTTRDDMTEEPDGPSIDKPKLAYSMAEAAAATGVSEGHLRRLVRNGYLAAVQPAGTSRLLIRTSELQAWLASGE